MAPKQRDTSDLQQQDVLQAVVLADSFVAHFRPVTFEMPKMLMPLANLPMIEYTLEFLAAGGVQEVFLFCCVHAEELQRYVTESNLAQRLATVSLHVLVAQGSCTSAGDALREVEARGVIKSDFILVPGDVVSNVSLAPLIAAHKERRKVDREAVLTTVMTRVPPSHRARRAGEAKLVALTGETGRLVMYDDARKRDWQHKVRLPMALLQESDRLALHSDLYDTHIDVCTPELLVLLQDNFDWQDLRRDLLPGVLGQFEMLGKTIYTHVLDTEYAARVHDPHTYDVVSRDIIHRWAFPLVPDANLLPGTTYRLSGHNVYRDGDVTLARSSTLVRDCVVGRGCSIGERTTVEASVLGAGCKIGAGVTLSGCYLWANVTVGDGASLNGCICCDGVVIGAGAIVAPGCVLGKGVHVASGSGLPRYARFWMPDSSMLERAEEDEEEEEDDDDEEEEVEGEAPPPVEGVVVSGYEYTERAARRAIAAATASARGKGDAALLGASGSGELWRIVPTAMSIGVERPRDLDGPVPGEESEEEEEEVQEIEDAEADATEAFAAEVSATVLRAISLDHEIDNLALEVNSIKFAQNRTFADCVRAIVPALLEQPSLQAAVKKERVANLKKAVKRWFKPLLSRFVQARPDRTALLEALVGACAASEPLLDIFEHVLNQMYEVDLLPQEAILQWADEAEAAEDDSEDSKCLARASNMIEWLRSEDDEDEETDEDDEEE